MEQLKNKENTPAWDMTKYLDKLKQSLQTPYEVFKSTLNSSEVKVWVAPKIPIYLRGSRLFPNWIPKTEKEMDKYLTKIEVPIYLLNWKTRKFTLYVHKKLASEFQAAFQDLYNIKFPINPEGLSSKYWRPKRGKPKEMSAHSYWVVVDINSWENWWDHRKSKTDSPYFITQKVVNIMWKHGFYWWWYFTTKKDPMHFTYINE